MDSNLIRSGTTEDLPEIISMAREFWQHTQFKAEEYDPYMVEAMAESCIAGGLMVVLVVDGSVEGFACGVAGPLLASGDVLAGTELAWWVNPEYRKGRHGIELMKGLESAAKAAGVKYWTMVAMTESSPETACKIYEKLGYELQELSYTRVL